MERGPGRSLNRAGFLLLSTIPLVFVMAWGLDGVSGHLTASGHLRGLLTDPFSSLSSVNNRIGDLAQSPGFWLRILVLYCIPSIWTVFVLSRVFHKWGRVLAGMADRAWLPPLIMAGSLFIIFFLATCMMDNEPRDLDESTYLFQARIFLRGHCAAPASFIDDENREFFVSKGEIVSNGKWFSQYPPLHPFLLSLGLRLDFPKLFGVFGSLIILLLAFFTASLYGQRRDALIAVMLCGSSPFFIFLQGTFLSEATYLIAFSGMLGLSAFISRGSGDGWPVLLGAILGAAFLIKEMVTVLFCVVLLLFLWREVRPFRLYLRTVSQIALGGLPLLLIWFWYNDAVTGHPFEMPRMLSDIRHFGFDERFTVHMSLTNLFRNLYVLSIDSFGWPFLGLVPAILRLVWGPPLHRFERMIYWFAASVVFVHLFVRNAGICYGARYYYPVWYALLFPGVVFFRTLGERLGREQSAGHGFALLLLVILMVINGLFYLPATATHYADFPFGDYSRWVTPPSRQVIAAMELTDAVVFVSPREWCYSSIPGSPFLDDTIIYLPDFGPRNMTVFPLFPDRSFFLLRQTEVRAAGHVITLRGR